MMSRFPSTVTRYMSRNSPQRMGCRSGSSKSFMRWNAETCAGFCATIMLTHLLQKQMRKWYYSVHKVVDTVTEREGFFPFIFIIYYLYSRFHMLVIPGG
jgi:hypothetical protein